MISLTPLQAFHVFSRHIFSFYDETDYEYDIIDALCDAYTNPVRTCHSGAATANSGVWDNWERLTDEVLKDEKLGRQNPNDILLTREQALRVMEYFLETRYWKKNNEMSMSEIKADIQNALNQVDFESTEIWQQWLTFAPKGLEFKETFDNEYYYRLEQMRQKYWADQELNEKK